MEVIWNCTEQVLQGANRGRWVAQFRDARATKDSVPYDKTLII
jgi:hypothetical protein